jgi:hypothetical protein
MFPEAVEQLVLVNPIGLEDWQAKGAPYLEIDKELILERQTNFNSVKDYEQRIYYAGQWHPEYDRRSCLQKSVQYRWRGRSQVMCSGEPDARKQAHLVYTKKVCQSDFANLIADC